MSLERNSKQHQMLQNDVNSIANLNCAPPSEKIDCFSILPPEMFLKIFKHLNLTSLGKCGTVSSYWNTIASDSTLYHNISEQLECEKQIKFFKMLIKRRNNVRKFDYKFYTDDVFSVESWDPALLRNSRSREDNFSKTLTQFFLHCCQKLTHLKLRSNCRIDIEWKPCFIKRWKLLHLNKLKSIEISSQFFQKERLIQLLKRNPDLECLKLDNCFGFMTLDSLFETIGRSNKKMTCLELYPIPNGRAQRKDKRRVEEIPIECSSLKKLKLTESKLSDLQRLFETFYFSMSTLTNLTNLSFIFKPEFPIDPTTVLHFEGIKNQTNNFCRDVFENLPKLEELELSSNLIPESEINRFEKLYPKLRIIGTDPSY